MRPWRRDPTVLKNAAVLAAFFVVALFDVARAQEVTVTRGGLSLSGEVLGYDGRYLRLATEAGEVTLDYDGATCSGASCPDPDAFVPIIRVSGNPRLLSALAPPLVDAYGRQSGLIVEIEGASHRLVPPDGGTPVLVLDLVPTSGEEGAADLVANVSDLVLLDRSLDTAELDLARAAGLGDLSDGDLGRIIALDAVVPVVAPGQDVQQIRVDTLEAAISGRVRNWSALGGPSGPLSVLLPEAPFLPLPGEPYDVSVAPLDEVARRVADTPGMLGLVGFGDGGNARPLAISGPCGRPILASEETVKSGDYPLTRPIFLYRPARRLPEAGEDFLTWLRSREAQGVIRRAGFVDLTSERIGLDRQGERLAGAIASAGPEIGLGELQRMVRILSGHDRLTATFRFQDGATRLTPQSRSYLLQLARAIAEGLHDGDRLMLVGFSDGRGPAMVNRDLSRARAEAVRRDLLAALGGVLPEGVTVTTEAFGEALPIACDEVQSGQNLNRRVELWVARRGG